MDTYIKSQFTELDDTPSFTKCLLCDSTFLLPVNEQEFLTHLFKEHRLVIGDVWKISSLKSYIHYWGIKFNAAPLTHYCTTLLMNCTPDGQSSKDEAYFLLSDCISEDKTLRDELHRAKLEWVLSEQSKERTDTNFVRGCLFCKMEFHGSRIEYIRHLSQKHNFHIGKPENLVFLDELLDKIQTTIESLVCVYCEKIFKDRVALKEHMRKKLHKRINPTNKAYDKYYVNNYLEPGRTWKQKQNRDNQENTNELSSENEDEETTWSDWSDENAGVLCLFCSHSDKNFSAIIHHLQNHHNFDFQDITKNMKFYEKIKVVNYVRQQMHHQCCILCETKDVNILAHMQESGHCKLPPRKVWDQPQFYFPMNESDPFLYHLDASDNSDEEDGIQDIRKKMVKLSHSKAEA